MSVKPKAKATTSKKPKVKVQDIKPKKNAKGGGIILNDIRSHNSGGGGGAG